MANLRKCRVCGELLSLKALQCGKCLDPDPFGQTLEKNVVIGIVVVLLVAFLLTEYFTGIFNIFG